MGRIGAGGVQDGVSFQIFALRMSLHSAAVYLGGIFFRRRGNISTGGEGLSVRIVDRLE